MAEDFILNEDGDFPLQDTVVNGEWIVTPYGPSDQQHVKDVIVYNFGALKHFPTIGFGVFKYQNSEFSFQSVEKSLKVEMAKEGYETRNGVVEPVGKSGFIIDTNYIFRK